MPQRVITRVPIDFGNNRIEPIGNFWSVNLIEFTDISVSVNYRSVSVNSVSVSVFDLPNRFTDYIIKTFCRLSQHPVVVEGRDYYHSNRLDATSRMVVVSLFYHHWMLR